MVNVLRQLLQCPLFAFVASKVDAAVERVEIGSARVKEKRRKSGHEKRI